MLKIGTIIGCLLFAAPFTIACNDSGNERDTDDKEKDPKKSGTDPDGTDSEEAYTSPCGDDFEIREGGFVCAGATYGFASTSTGASAGGTIDPEEFSGLEEGDDLCVSGTAAADYSSLGIVHISARQEPESDTVEPWTPSGDGLSVNIETNGSFPLRFQIKLDGGAEYCTAIDSGANSIKWSDLTRECWFEDGEVYNGSDPIEQFMIMVPGDVNETIDFDFCVKEFLVDGSAEAQVSEEDTDPVDTPDIEDDCSEGDKTVCEDEIDRHCGYTYEFWQDQAQGSVCMEVESGGGFSIEWGNTNNVLARKGIRPGSDDIVVTYDADYNAEGESYLGIYGWTKNPLIEYYILDNWGAWRPRGDLTPIDTIESDDGTYDIYLTTRVDKPSIEGTATFDQYWSVRRNKRSSGIITVGNHFDAWRDNDMEMGSLYEVSMVAEGFHSTGSADVQMSMTTKK